MACAISEARVEPMTNDEARFVVTDGMAKLELLISNDDVESIIRTAAGAPGRSPGRWRLEAS